MKEINKTQVNNIISNYRNHDGQGNQKETQETMRLKQKGHENETEFKTKCDVHKSILNIIHHNILLITLGNKLNQRFKYKS